MDSLVTVVVDCKVVVDPPVTLVVSCAVVDDITFPVISGLNGFVDALLKAVG